MKKTILALIASGALLIAAGSAYAGGPAPSLTHSHSGPRTHTRVHESISFHFGFGPRHCRPDPGYWRWRRANWRWHHRHWRWRHHHRYYW